MSMYESNLINEENLLWEQFKSNDIHENEVNRKGKWSPDEDKLLSVLVKQYDYKNWKKIAQKIKGRTAIQCLHRWSKILQPGLVKGPWTSAEDAKLIEWVEREGPTKWSLCAETIKGRSGKQCREHWNNSLSPNIKKGMWSLEEDFLILFYYMNLQGSWKKISPFFVGRTENSIKNRFFSQLRKIASSSLESSEKKMTSKIKLVTLLNYIPKAFEISAQQVKNYLNLTNEEYEEYLQMLTNDITKKKSSKSAISECLHEKETKEESVEGFLNQNKEINLSNEKDKYDCFDIETLEKEIFDQCDNSAFFLGHENDIDFENSLDNAINNALQAKVKLMDNSNCLNCDFVQPLEMDEKHQGYYFLMNKLLDLEKKVQATKIKLKQYEDSERR